MDDLDFDFGFTAVTEDELDVVKKNQTTVNKAEKLATTTQDRLDKLYNAIVPLLNNLKKNPEKEYIHWPNRTAIIDKQIEKIRAVTQFYE